MFCEKCGKQIADDSVFCEYCGAEIAPPLHQETCIEPDENVVQTQEPLKEEQAVQTEETPMENEETLMENTVICPNCGANLAIDAKFCDRCGIPIGVSQEENGGQPSKVFCKNCGKELASGARFCDGCGVPQGVYIPPVPPKPAEPSLFSILIQKFFKEPTGAVRLAAEKEGVMLGVIFFLIKDAILAILSAMLMSKLIYELGIFGLLFSDGDTFVAAMKVFFIAVMMDALWVILLFGGGKAFGGNSTFSALIGGSGISSIMLSIGWILTAIFMAISVPLSACSLFALIGIAAVSAYVVLAEVMRVSKDKSFYAASLIIIAYFLIIYIVTYIILDSNL